MTASDTFLSLNYDFEKLLDYLENNSGDVDNKTVEKIIPIHKAEKHKRSGFNSSGQGYDLNYNLWRLKFDKCALNACCWKTSTES